MESGSVESWGRQIFFLYPHAVVQEELLPILLEQEYEVYLVKDYERLAMLLRESRDSVLILNVDAEIKGLKWSEYARSIVALGSGTKLAALTYREDRTLVQTFVAELGCELIVVKAGIEESRSALLKVLSEAGAIGKRKYVRASCNDAAIASFNVKYAGHIHAGVVKDISSAGFAGTFTGALRLSAETHLTDIQLRLRGRLIRASGVVALTRRSNDGPEVNVVLFDRRTEPETRAKLRLFIHELLQTELDRRLMTLSAKA